MIIMLALTFMQIVTVIPNDNDDGSNKTKETEPRALVCLS